jgi:hypothetical protein
MPVFRPIEIISRIIWRKDKENRWGKNQNLQYMLEYTCSFDSLNGVVPEPVEGPKGSITNDNPGP